MLCTAPRWLTRWLMTPCLTRVLRLGPGFAKDQFKEHLEQEAVRREVRCVQDGRHAIGCGCGCMRMSSRRCVWPATAKPDFEEQSSSRFMLATVPSQAAD